LIDNGKLRDISRSQGSRFASNQSQCLRFKTLSWLSLSTWTGLMLVSRELLIKESTWRT